LTSLPSEGQSLWANQISSTYLNWWLRYNYFRFWKINVRHIGNLTLHKIRKYWFFNHISIFAAAAPFWVLTVMWIWHVPARWYVILRPNSRSDLVQNLLYCLTSTHFCFRHSFDNITRINCRLWFLITQSSPYRRDASSCQIWCSLDPVHSYWHFPKFKIAASSIFVFLNYVNFACFDMLVIGILMPDSVRNYKIWFTYLL